MATADYISAQALPANVEAERSILGAILLTGYLGGAVATHFRVGSSLFGETLFPVYIGILMWGGLYGREARLRALIPFSRAARAAASESPLRRQAAAARL